MALEIFWPLDEKSLVEYIEEISLITCRSKKSATTISISSSLLFLNPFPSLFLLSYPFPSIYFFFIISIYSLDSDSIRNIKHKGMNEVEFYVETTCLKEG